MTWRARSGIALAALGGYVFGHSVVPVPVPVCPSCATPGPAAAIPPVRLTCPETGVIPSGRSISPEWWKDRVRLERERSRRAR